jgi:hypothetical protein
LFPLSVSLPLTDDVLLDFGASGGR